MNQMEVLQKMSKFVLFILLFMSATKDCQSDLCDAKNKNFFNCPMYLANDANECKTVTVGTKKVMGRLGNHLWALMIGFGISKKYGIQMTAFRETIDFVQPYFENFEHCPTLEEDFCGFKDFFEHFRSFVDLKIEEFYSNKAGKQLKFFRSEVGTQLIVPPEYGNRWKINYKELIDSKPFIEQYSPTKYVTPNCPYEWEIFREDIDTLLLEDVRCGRALLIQPGISTIDDFKLLNSVPNFAEEFFPRLRFRETILKSAASMLHVVRQKHWNKKTSNKGKAKGKGSNEFVFVGIHGRGTDHIQYEIDRGFKPLKTAYFLDAMHMFREQFKAESKSGRLVFVYVSDDMPSGRQKLANRNKEQDLYFAGNGLVDDVDAIGRDLALLALCNHTIESHGSFSFFAGALSGGYRIVPQHFEEYVSSTDTLLPDPFEKPLPRIYSRNATQNVYKSK